MRAFIDEWYLMCEDKISESKHINFNRFQIYKHDSFDHPMETKTAMTHSDTLRDKYLNMEFNRFKTMGRVGKFNKYRNHIKYGLLVEEERKVNLYNKKIKDLLKEPYSYESSLPLPVNEVSKLIGVHRGKYPLKFFKGDYNVDWTAREFLRTTNETFREFDDNNSVRVLPGTWRYNGINLVNMATPHKKKYTYDEMFEGLRSRKDIELVLPSLPGYNVDSINNVKVNHTSFNGLNTSLAFGGKRKFSTKYTKPAAHYYAKEVIMKPRGEYVLDTSLYHVGGREKRIISPYQSPYKEVRTRATLCQEDVPTIIGQSLVTPINETLQKLAEGFNWGGRINGRGRFFSFVNNLDIREVNKKRHYINRLANFNTDFSEHDNNVSKEQIIFGMALLRCCYPVCKKIDRMFFYVLSSLTHKRVALPESRLIYEIQKGIPSGHSFTSILTTVCAYVTISTAMNKVIPKSKIKETYLQGAGDDWNGKIHKRYANMVSTEINNNSGSKCDDFNINLEDIRVDKDSRKPTFLKKNYKYGLLAWNKVELFTNYSYPTSRKQTLGQYKENAFVMCISGPFDMSLNRIMQNLVAIKTIEKLVHDGMALGYQINKHVKGNSSEMISKLIKKHFSWNGAGAIDLKHKVFDPMDIRLSNGVLIKKLKPRELLSDWFIDFNDRITYSMRWMLREAIHERFEVTVRLRVFDTKKKYIKNTSYEPRDNYFNWIYNDKSISIC